MTEQGNQEPQTPWTGNVTETDRPQQFKSIEDRLHAERERVKALTLDWRPSLSVDRRDTRQAQLLGETLLALGKPTSPVQSEDGTVRMQPSLGSLSDRHDLIEEFA